MSKGRPDRKRRLPGGLSGVCVALLGGVLMTVITLTIGTAAGAHGLATTPQPTPGEIAAARHSCAAVRHNRPGNPSVIDNGDGVYVSLWPVQQTCIYAASGAAAATTSAPPPSSGVSADSIQRLSGILSACTTDCDPNSDPTGTPTTTTITTGTTTKTYPSNCNASGCTTGAPQTRQYVNATFLDGIAGREITGVTVDLSNHKSVKAILANGHYLAWWADANGAVTATKAIATLSNGKTVNFSVPPVALAKFCIQQMEQGASSCVTPVTEN